MPLLTLPDVVRPGQRMMQGVRIAPSQPLGNSPRKGPESARPPKSTPIPWKL